VPESVPDVEGTPTVEPIAGAEDEGRWGNKRVVITSVEFIDKFGNNGTTFMSGDLMKIRLLYYAPELVEEPVFGVAIYNVDGLQCFGTNTELKNTPVESVDGVGHIDLIIEKIPMQQFIAKIICIMTGGTKNIHLMLQGAEEMLACLTFLANGKVIKHRVNNIYT
jgi:hypothetical protein